LHRRDKHVLERPHVLGARDAPGTAMNGWIPLRAWRDQTLCRAVTKSASPEVTVPTIASIGWNIKSMDERRIVPKVGVGISRNPSNIEVLLASADASRTTVSLNGSIVGVGPVQKSHLRGEVNRLRNAIEVAAKQALPAHAADASGAEPTRSSNCASSDN